MTDAKGENERLQGEDAEVIRKRVENIDRDYPNQTNLMSLMNEVDRTRAREAELETRIEQLTKVLERIERHSSEGLELFEHDCRFYLANVLELAMKTLSDLKKGEEA